MNDKAHALVNGWLAALEARHRTNLTRPEFLKAVRALSARYVEQRHALPGRSPIDSDGKRAAFAAFYAPIHLVTAHEIVRAIGVPTRGVKTIADLGCGTGVASAGWAMAIDDGPRLHGVDTHAWATTEAKWNWHALGLHGDVARGDLLDGVRRMQRQPRTLAHAAAVLGWSVNELPAPARDALLPRLMDLAAHGARVLVIEPISRAATPWWRHWIQAFTSAGGRDDEWSFDADLPPALAALSTEAGFRRDRLTAKSLFL